MVEEQQRPDAHEFPGPDADHQDTQLIWKLGVACSDMENDPLSGDAREQQLVIEARREK